MKPDYLPLIVAAALAAMSTSAAASGYRFGSQSVAAQGTADANAAEAADASTLFYNPAGMSRLQGQHFSAGTTAVVPHSTYTDTGSKRFTGTATGGAATDEYAPDFVVAPSLYYTKQINSQWTAGMGLFVPYGTKLNYGDNWHGRYALTNIKLEAIALNPSASFKLNERHSFGFGATAEFMKAELGQAVDVPGTVAALAGTPNSAALVRQIVALGGNPAALAAVKDGRGENDGKDWGFGFNLGYMFQLNQDTRFGMSYRSPISHKLKGSTVWDFSRVTSDQVVNKVLAASSRKVNSAALVALRTPETLSLNGFHQINARWAAMGDVTWTRHSRLGDLHIEFPGTDEGDEVIRQQWKNTVRVSLGANYQFDDKLTLRGGIAHDQTPVNGDQLRHPALPDSDRNQLSFGANYTLSPRASIDLAYSYLHFKDAHADYRNNCSPLTAACTGNGETTRGTYQTRLQLLGVAFNYRY
ncbi:outer membrane transport protein, OMPP1/FadL/TodX family [Massilia sp. Root351]|uniref:OmpP1/FadL family transporter n=1 Tax=Massilia sp. Root351 TaxID=1736522 RepID=UPI000710C95C|nr:OmpP1/FadL family transporter [Massilia sp. Root351]KQV85876.1 outer membrane transport protein, OMPP1/FadL/TodX family [Massilia sp. Root351]